MPRLPFPANIWAKVDRHGPVPDARPDLGRCWIWTGARTEQRGGYGQACVPGRKVRPAHQVVYELAVGPVPDGCELDHLCRVHECVNPAHLEPVTHRENVLRGESPVAARAAQTHCTRGHEFTPENTGPNSGGRRCRRCHREREAARRAAEPEGGTP